MKTVEENISKTPIIPKPYEHLIVENVFGDLYQEILKGLPERSKYTYCTNYPGMHTATTEPGGIWKEVLDYFRSENWAKFILDKFNLVFENHHVAFTMLHKDLCGYQIPPHPDVSSKIITYMFYLPMDESMMEYGTYVCTKKVEKPRCEWSDFDNVKLVPFKPNSLFAFKVSETSYHAVKIPKSETRFRDVLRGFIFDKRKKMPGYTKS